MHCSKGDYTNYFSCDKVLDNSNLRLAGRVLSGSQFETIAHYGRKSWQQDLLVQAVGHVPFRANRNENLCSVHDLLLI